MWILWVNIHTSGGYCHLCDVYMHSLSLSLSLSLSESLSLSLGLSLSLSLWFTINLSCLLAGTSVDPCWLLQCWCQILGEIMCKINLVIQPLGDLLFEVPLDRFAIHCSISISCGSPSNEYGSAGLCRALLTLAIVVSYQSGKYFGHQWQCN